MEETNEEFSAYSVKMIPKYCAKLYKIMCAIQISTQFVIHFCAQQLRLGQHRKQKQKYPHQKV